MTSFLFLFSYAVNICVLCVCVLHHYYCHLAFNFSRFSSEYLKSKNKQKKMFVFIYFRHQIFVVSFLCLAYLSQASLMTSDCLYFSQCYHLKSHLFLFTKRIQCLFKKLFQESVECAKVGMTECIKRAWDHRAILIHITALRSSFGVKKF